MPETIDYRRFKCSRCKCTAFSVLVGKDGGSGRLSMSLACEHCDNYHHFHALELITE